MPGFQKRSENQHRTVPMSESFAGNIRKQWQPKDLFMKGSSLITKKPEIQTLGRFSSEVNCQQPIQFFWWAYCGTNRGFMWMLWVSVFVPHRNLKDPTNSITSVSTPPKLPQLFQGTTKHTAATMASIIAQCTRGQVYISCHKWATQVSTLINPITCRSKISGNEHWHSPDVKDPYKFMNANVCKM